MNRLREDGADENDEPDLSNGIRYKRDEEDESDFKLRTQKESGDGRKPLIQELDATASKQVEQKKKARE